MYQFIILSSLALLLGSHPNLTVQKRGLKADVNRKCVACNLETTALGSSGSHDHPLLTESMEVKGIWFLDNEPGGHGTGNGIQDPGEPTIGLIITVNHTRGFAAPDGEGNYSNQLSLIWQGGHISLTPFP